MQCQTKQSVAKQCGTKLSPPPPVSCRIGESWPAVVKVGLAAKCFHERSYVTREPMITTATFTTNGEVPLKVRPARNFNRRHKLRRFPA